MKIKWWCVAVCAALLIAALSPLASNSPDGLERVAEDAGFIEKGQQPPFFVVPEYSFPGIHDEAASTIIAGVMGTSLLFGIGIGLAYLLRIRKNET